MKKKIFIRIVIVLTILSVLLFVGLNIYKEYLREKITAYNAQMETNEDGIVVDMSANPYFTKKQIGFKYRAPITITYPSEITGTDRHAMVFLPADYDENKEYPVLYLLHGLDGSHRTWRNKSADIILQNMYYFDGVPEMIVVCPNSAVNEDESTDDLEIKDKVAVYNLTGEDLVENLMPYINENFPVKTGPENTAIAGNSMGGRNTMYTAFTYPELFGYVGVFSSAGVMLNEEYKGIMNPLLEDLSLDKDFELLMLCVGRTDNVCGQVTYDLHDKMTEEGIEHIFYDTEGGHQNTVWQNALYNFARKLFRENLEQAEDEDVEYPTKEFVEKVEEHPDTDKPNDTYGSYYKPWEFRDMNLNDYDSEWCWERSAESEHFYVFWQKEFGTNPNASAVPEHMRVDIDDLLEKAEKFFDTNVKELGFYNPDEMRNVVSNFKIHIYIYYQEEWLATGSGYDDKVAALWINPSTCKPVGSTIAHEIGHCFQYLVYCNQVSSGEENDFKHGFRYGYEGSNGGNGFWEQTAQWQAMQDYPQELFLDYNMYTWFRMNNKSFENEWMRYQSYWFFYYMTEKHGIDTVSNIWKNSIYPEDSLSCYMRLYLDNDLEALYDELFDYAMHMATFDLDAIRDYAGDYYKDYNIKLYDAGAGYEQVAYSDCPEPGGFNIIPIDIEEHQTTVTVDFKALPVGASLSSEDPGEYKVNGDYEGVVANYNNIDINVGYRYGFVALCEDGTRVYGGMHEGDEQVVNFTVPDDATDIFFVILATSDEYYCHTWDDDELTDAMAPFKLKIY